MMKEIVELLFRCAVLKVAGPILDELTYHHRISDGTNLAVLSVVTIWCLYGICDAWYKIYKMSKKAEEKDEDLQDPLPKE